MPYISTKTSLTISAQQEQELVSRYGKAIALIGKSEAHLMLDFQDNCRMYFAGSNAKPSVFLDVSLLGKATREGYDKLTEKLCADVSEILGVDDGCIYVKYEEAGTWGMNGFNFQRIKL